MKVYQTITDLVGRTPLLEVTKIEAEEQTGAKIFAKLELFNPAGSVKDRVAVAMINDAEKRGVLKPDSVIIEPTSGNTGIGLAALCAAKGYRLTIVMPDTMSAERRQLIAAFGAELVLTEGKRGMAGAIERAEKLHAETENSLIAGQFVNPANPLAHYKTTGPEIWTDTDGEADIFVAGVGTGGTVTGVGRYLKEKKPSVKIVAVEPASSPVLEGGAAGPHKIQGIGAGFVPENFASDVCDEIVSVTDDEAYAFARLLAQREGLLAGISSGAALAAAVKEAKRQENAGKTVVALLPDTGDRYLSCGVFA